MILISHHHPVLRFPKRETLRAIHSVLHHEAVTPFPVSVVFVGNRFMRRINRQFLNHDYNTDVISFPLGGDDEPGAQGEIYINLDRAKRQAREFGVTFRGETRRLLIHGMLHLLGYKDATPSQKAVMAGREDLILSRLKQSYDRE